ncbi:hypothetical protein [Candidatus Methanodesulfokora washburnensis]|jgi:hypothetical protein|uniref:Uncharacterized protein n=1 Tax=Candidatus Methanodesulfokora washburnensis TaxID=2478471 RepID=A0A3R9R0W0_9CREN|nr:hypothetical protein [Candidatus Methanodesulfokores washburnensis]RSN76684.1 hypothetical protein D6D85_03710 [Candidatus Methanodesulfokores washburnensis]
MDSNRHLIFKDVSIHFLCLGILKGDLDIKNWEIDTHIENDIYLKRLFHNRYFSVIKKVYMKTFPPLQILGIDENSFRSIPWEKESVKNSVLEQFIKEKNLLHRKLQIKIWVYPANKQKVIASCITLQLDGEYTTDHLLVLTNALSDFDGKLILMNSERLTLKDIILKILQKNREEIEFYPTFSIIHPRSLSPLFDNYEDYFQEYSRELFAIAVRRTLRYWDIRKENTRRGVHENLSIYNSDIIFINYHNMFCYIGGPLPIDFYFEIVKTMKIFEVLLHFFNKIIFEELEKVKSLPRKSKELRKIVKELEELKTEVSRVLVTYEMLTSISTKRGSIILEKCKETFGINKLEQSLLSNLKDVEDLLSKRYNLELQERLRRIEILLAAFTTIVTLLGMIGIDRLIDWLVTVLKP